MCAWRTISYDGDLISARYTEQSWIIMLQLVRFGYKKWGTLLHLYEALGSFLQQNINHLAYKKETTICQVISSSLKFHRAPLKYRNCLAVSLF